MARASVKGLQFLAFEEINCFYLLVVITLPG
ncbi:hypothetical protein T05_12622 [Trichinella murrelli]|uniref:Uncharacterized protein n=1 Tax=Trichinella murrelli TaxID=144512 RepID=A0A0V0SZA4_9BILA|nr:hypothetical protein T05_12622 [Trichinella murrelli]